MAERPRELGDFKSVGQLRLNFSALDVKVKKFKKARVNSGTDNDSFKDSHKSLRCR